MPTVLSPVLIVSSPNFEELDASRGMLALRHPILLDGSRPECPPQDPHNTYLPSYTLENKLPVSVEAAVPNLAGEAVKTATHQCSICAKTFTRPFNLRNHVRSHQGERSHACVTCGKAFVRKHDRDEHIRQVHCGHSEKRFVCTGCGHRFARKRALNRHHESKAGQGCVRSSPPGLEQPGGEERSSSRPDHLSGELQPPAQPTRNSPSPQLGAPEGRPRQARYHPYRTHTLLTPAGDVAISSAARPSGWCRPPRVLLIEADPTCRRICSRFLQSFGCMLYATAGNLEARVKLKGGPNYDIILADDSVSWFGLSRFVPMIDSTILIAMIHGSVSERPVGMRDFLQKPFTRLTLFEILQKHLPHLSVAKNDADLRSEKSNHVQDRGGDALSVLSDGASKASPWVRSEGQLQLADIQGEQDHQVEDWLVVPFPGLPLGPLGGW